MNCKYCDYVTKDSKILEKHHQKVHSKPNMHYCLLCNKYYKSRPSLLNHKKMQVHNILYGIKNILNPIMISILSKRNTVSEDKTSEEEWQVNYTRAELFKHIMFESICKLDTFIEDNLINGIYSYVLCSGARATSQYTKNYYRCNYRTGNKLSCKSCYSIKKTRRQTYILEFNSFHNHPINFDNLRISKHVKKELVEKIKLGISLRVIYESILNSIKNEITSKKQLVTMAYLRYLKNEYTITSRLNKSDLKSTITNIKILVSSKNIRYVHTNIESIGDMTNNEDFFLIFQTADQVSFLEKKQDYNCLLIDATHSTNIYNYKLIIGSVLDESLRPRPIFYSIMSSESIKMLMKLFTYLKSTSMKNFRIKYFMSDLAPQYFNAFSNVYDICVLWLYCLWHLEKAIGKNLIAKIKNQSIRTSIKEKFNELIMTVDMQSFRKKLKQFKTILNKKSPEFENYFLKYYNSCPERWALVYRKKSYVNTNMFQETLFRSFKRNYLARIKYNRLDFLLSKLISFDGHIVSIHIRSLATNNLEEKGHRFKQMEHSHNKATEQKKYKIHKEVTGYSVNDYRVILRKPYICETKCGIICQKCDVCYHYVTCTCLAFLSTKVFCKHIHVLALYLQKEGKMKQKATQNNNNIDTQSVFSVISENPIDTVKKEPNFTYVEDDDVVRKFEDEGNLFRIQNGAEINPLVSSMKNNDVGKSSRLKTSMNVFLSCGTSLNQQELLPTSKHIELKNLIKNVSNLLSICKSFKTNEKIEFANMKISCLNKALRDELIKEGKYNNEKRVMKKQKRL